MKTFAEKVREARLQRQLSQTELGNRIGVTIRTITSYEKEGKMPRKKMLYALAKELGVSTRYLIDENCDDPLAEIEEDAYLEEAREKYGASGERDVDGLLAANTALFAGGELSQDQKDAFFAAIVAAYAKCKEEASKKFNPHKNSKVQ